MSYNYGTQKPTSDEPEETWQMEANETGAQTYHHQNALEIDNHKKKLSLFRIIMFVMFEFFVLLFMGYNWAFLMPLHVRQMVADSGNRSFLMALISTSASLSSVIASIMTGLISDRICTRFGRRKPFIVLPTLLMIITLLVRSILPIQNAPYTIIALYTFMYLVGNGSLGAVTSAYRSLIPDVVPKDQIGLVSGLFGFSAMLGLVFGLGVFAFLSSYLSTLVNSSIICFLLLPSCLCVLLMFPEPESHYCYGRLIQFSTTRPQHASASLVANTSIQDYDGVLAESDPLVKQVQAQEPMISKFSLLTNAITSSKHNPFANWNYSWVFTSRLFYNFGTSLFMTYTMFFFADSFRQDFSILFWDNLVKNAVQANSIYLISMLVSSLLSSVVCGAMSDSMGRKVFIYLGTALVATGMLGTMITRTYSLVLILSVITGIGIGSYHAVDTGLVADVLDKEHAARDLAFWNLSMSIPHLVSSPVAGAMVGLCDKLFAQGKLLKPHMGYSLLFLTGALFQVLAAGAIMFVRLSKNSKEGEKSKIKRKRHKNQNQYTEKSKRISKTLSSMFDNQEKKEQSSLPSTEEVREPGSIP